MTNHLSNEVFTLSTRVIASASEKDMLIATAESCTGGLIGGALTDIAGSSSAFDRGFITYSNHAKNEMLGVSMATIKADGAVSSSVAKAMAEGALERSNAHIAVAVTGIAGPGGGSLEKPVGLVWFGIAVKNKTTICEQHIFADDGREAIRLQTVHTALSLIQSALLASSCDG